MTQRRKKLIEVALPLKKINEQSSREKSIRHGHPSTLHLWWARRPLAACRAVLFAQLVDDPSSDPAYRRPDGSVDEERAGIKRAELFNLIEELVRWENSNNPRVIDAARAEIARCVASRKIELGELKKETMIIGREEGKTHPDGPLPNDGRYTAWQVNCRLAPSEAVNHFLEKYAPPVLDPFAGGGSIPLEAQRLGLRAHASDLNPVPVLINKALIEIPPKFAGLPPVFPGAQASRLQSANETSATTGFWTGAQGLAEDVRYYGKWMRDEAEKRIGHLYPRVKITQEMVEGTPGSAGVPPAKCGQDARAPRPDLKPYLGQELTVIAWLWARTVKCPNPACGCRMPMLRSFWLSKKKGKEVYAQPIVDNGEVTFRPVSGKDGVPEHTTDRTGAKCIFCGQFIKKPELRELACKYGVDEIPLAIVAEGDCGRVYLPFPEEQIPRINKPDEPAVQQSLVDDKRWFSPPLYGLPEYADLFTPRQLTALTTFSDLVAEARQKVLEDTLGARASRPPYADKMSALPAESPAESPESVHNRGYLPHWEAGARPQAITFRLADSLPRTVLEQLDSELASLSETKRDIERRKRIEETLDRGTGRCWLRRPEIAALVKDALMHFNGMRYKLHSWVIMPNHVHVLITPLHGNSLSSILHSWKSFTAKKANEILGHDGAFWQAEYFDRMIRDERHFHAAIEYIHNNPVKAGLCASPDEWPFGSAGSAGILPANQDGERMRAGRPRSREEAYADAVATYLGFAVDKAGDYWSTVATWATGGFIRGTFARQALPMTWDFAECNPFSDSTGNWSSATEWAYLVLGHILSGPISEVGQSSATDPDTYSGEIISTDPPYYDNIGYADLSDFFYVWLRRSLREVYPDLLSTMLTPKAEELIASPYRHGGNKKKAAQFFETGLGQAIQRWREQGHPDYPATIFYAFKQAETDKSGTASTGWETFLSGVIDAGFTITATWPMRTERSVRSVAIGTNALASSVVLACVPRAEDASLATRREFIAALKQELAEALRLLQSGSIAPVDLAQAAIGPGMAIFSRYAKVVESDGSPMTVRTALTLINQVLDEVLAEQEGEFDSDTRWAVAWFEQFGISDGPYGVAETLSKAKNTSVQGLVDAGVVASKGGKVKLLGAQASSLQDDWDPARDARLTEWEAVQHLIRALDRQGETGAADLLRKLGSDYGERARDLAYRLYAICERKGWSGEALAYNSLVIAWPEISKLAHRTLAQTHEQMDMF